MIGDKEERFQGKGTDLSALQGHIEEYVKNEGFKTQTSAPSTEGSVIQARKGGWLAGVIAADRALTITTTGNPDDFTVRVGIGKWVEHLGVTAVEALVISGLFLVVDVPEMAWNIEIENKLMKDIRSFVDGPSEHESAEAAQPAGRWRRVSRQGRRRLRRLRRPIRLGRPRLARLSRQGRRRLGRPSRLGRQNRPPAESRAAAPAERPVRAGPGGAYSRRSSRLAIRSTADRSSSAWKAKGTLSTCRGEPSGCRRRRRRAICARWAPERT